MYRFVCVVLGLAPLVATATPTTMTQQGRLLDTLGNPIEGAHSLTFRLYDAAADGTAVWSESVSTTLSDGYFTVELGHDVPLDTSVFTGADRWLAIAVDSAPELDGRKHVDALPYAQHAGMADSVQWTDVQGIPADLADGDDVLDEAQVETMVTNGPLDLDAGTTLGGQSIQTALASGIVHGNVVVSDTDATADTSTGEISLPGTSVTLTPSRVGSKLYAHLDVNIRLRYDTADRCELRLRANGGGFSNTVIGKGDLYHGVAADSFGHQQPSISGVLTTTSTDPITITATLKAVDGNGDADTVCYSGHRAENVLMVMEMIP